MLSAFTAAACVHTRRASDKDCVCLSVCACVCVSVNALCVSFAPPSIALVSHESVIFPRLTRLFLLILCFLSPPRWLPSVLFSSPLFAALPTHNLPSLLVNYGLQVRSQRINKSSCQRCAAEEKEKNKHQAPGDFGFCGSRRAFLRKAAQKMTRSESTTASACV